MSDQASWFDMFPSIFYSSAHWWLMFHEIYSVATKNRFGAAEVPCGWTDPWMLAGVPALKRKTGRKQKMIIFKFCKHGTNQLITL